MKNIIQLVVFLYLFNISNTSAQINITPEEYQALGVNPISPKTLVFNPDGTLVVPTELSFATNQLVSNVSFNELVSSDLNYLVVGDNTPDQGLDFSLTDDNSKITLKATATSLFWKGLLTVDGEFKANDGDYFFSSDEGSTSSKITANFFFPVYSARNYDLAENKHVQLAIFQNEIEKQALIEKVVKEYKTAIAKMEALSLPLANKKNVDKALAKRNHINRYMKFLSNLEKFRYLINDSAIENEKLLKGKEFSHEKGKINFLKKKKTKNNDLDEEGKRKGKFKKDTIIVLSENLKMKSEYRQVTKEVKTTVETNRNNKKEVVVKNEDKGVVSYLKAKETINEFLKATAALDSIDSKLYALEAKIAQPFWNTKLIHFVAISPFYKRESFDIFNYINDTVFDGNFNKVRGDVYGANLSYNIYRQSNRSYSPWKRLFVKLSANLERTSNFDAFEKETYSVILPTENTINTVPITTTETETGYTHKTDTTIGYDYGFETMGKAELYLFPFNDFAGVFGTVEARKRFNIDGETSDASERYGFRLGALFNVKNKSKKGNLLTIQVFANRSDVTKSPRGDDNDLQYGFKVGLPVNFSAQL